MDTLDYLKALQRRWRVIVAATIIGLLVGAAITRFEGDPEPVQRTWEATTVLIPVGDLAGTGLPAFGQTSNIQVAAAVTTFDGVAGRAADALAYEGDPSDLASRVSAFVDRDTGLLRITATTTPAPRARELADAFATGLQAYLTGQQRQLIQARIADIDGGLAVLQRRIETLTGRLETPVNDQATAALQSALEERDGLLSQRRDLAQIEPTSGLRTVFRSDPVPIAITGFRAPTSPLFRLALGGILCLALGIALALVLERFDTRIRTRETAAARFGLPVLSEIPLLRGRARSTIVTAEEPNSASTEAFRLLALEVQQGVMPRGEDGARDGAAVPEILLVTSPGPTEGKTTVAANLAVALAEMGKRVIVLSCDLRRPRIHRLFDVPSEDGIVAALEGPADGSVLNGHLRATAFTGVEIVPTGPPPDRPGELVSSPRLGAVIREARALSDVVVIDAPPVLPVSDVAHLLPEVDAVLLVARVGRTTEGAAAKAVELLRRLEAPLTGVVLNGVAETLLTRSYKGYQTAGERVLFSDAQPEPETSSSVTE